MSADRLETVLRVRRIAQQRALAEVAAATRDLEHAVAARAAAMEVLDQHVSRAGDVGGLRAARLAGVALRHRADEALEQQSAAQSTRAGHVRAWQRTRSDERAVERLVERRREVAVAAALAADQARLDELALLRRGRDAR